MFESCHGAGLLLSSGGSDFTLKSCLQIDLSATFKQTDLGLGPQGTCGASGKLGSCFRLRVRSLDLELLGIGQPRGSKPKAQHPQTQNSNPARHK